MRHERQGRVRWLTPVVAAVLVLPASYFGVNAALEHLGGGQAAASAIGCQGVGCGASPAAAAAPLSTTSPAHSGTASRRPTSTPKAQVKGARAHPARTSAPATPRPSTPAAKPSPTASATPPPQPQVTAAYQQQNGWPGGFMGNFTVLDHGAQPVGTWKLTITLPGDMVTGVFGASWSQHGDVVVLEPEFGASPLEPGVAQTITVVADGNAAAPASCTLDGGACT